MGYNVTPPDINVRGEKFEDSADPIRVAFEAYRKGREQTTLGDVDARELAEHIKAALP
ncbi:hypothetical protein [Mycobacterium asiaticum]|uniref:hypothetical protein n=1 Tax=Mycobacterium asiaticum TaxID=1790 RepID=UPI000A9311D8|nr:hypothetical protein [Mycobacterium asiaticum]